ncbi:MAG: aminotransferase class I/II-fold pyridoxal phosphate-dependent enzyme, partial [Candidatus Omnitrophica bacterium]|nr:aminotransferase class I/II-fold pyridoxal phosphate-dependent enzyme [Candidatus Omnitrophota bacterium]
MQIIPTFKSTLRFQEINRASLRLLAQKKSGRYKEDFKSLLMEYLGTGNIVFVPSARWGLYFILKNLDIPIGAEVIVSAFNYYAVPAAIIRAGMKPVFVDISENGIGIDISKIEQAVTDQTKVLIVTHLCGFVADMEKISAIARKHGLIIIEDCAQAFGAAVGTRKAGSFGDHAFFTFGLTKNFTAFGSGAVVTKNRNLLEMMEHDLSKLQQTSYRRTLLQLFWAYAILFATSRILFPLIYWVIR